MKSLREMERQIEAMEAESKANALRLTTDEGKNLLLPFRDDDSVLDLIVSSIKNENHPYKKYIMQAKTGYPDDGQLVLLCKAIWQSHERIAAEKEGVE